MATRGETRVEARAHQQRTEARGQQRDEARVQQRDEARGQRRHEVNGQQRNEERDEARGQGHHEARGQARNEARGQTGDEEHGHACGEAWGAVVPWRDRVRVRSYALSDLIGAWENELFDQADVTCAEPSAPSQGEREGCSRGYVAQVPLAATPSLTASSSMPLPALAPAALAAPEANNYLGAEPFPAQPGVVASGGLESTMTRLLDALQLGASVKASGARALPPRVP